MRTTRRRSRSELLASPLFAGSIALLLINDHLLKAAWPGFVTGKLSDVAGVTMVAIVATAVLGPPRPALALTALAFVLLKTVPAVAVWAEPVLGGRTRTDPTDLVALAVLVPLARWIARPGRADPRRLRRSWVVVLHAAAVSSAVVATTATSCERSSVGAVWLIDEGFEIDDGARVERSGDGYDWRFVGWSEQTPTPASEPPVSEACAAGTCWRVDGSAVWERPIDGGEERIVFAYTGDQIRTMDRNADVMCGQAAEDGFAAVAARDDETVVVAMESHGVLVGDPSGSWQRVATQHVEPISLDEFELRATVRTVLIVLPFVVATLGGVVAVVRSRGRPNLSWVGPAVGALLLVGIAAIWMLIGLGAPGARFDRAISVASPVMVGITVVALGVCSYLVGRPRRPWSAPRPDRRVG